MSLFVRKCMRATEGLKREEGRNTLKYVDDLLICARDEVTCVADTVTLLNHLAREGHKVSLTKLQFVKQEIIFWGHARLWGTLEAQKFFEVGWTSDIKRIACV